MAQFAYDGNVRIAYVEGEDSIADITSPTTTELAGSTDLSELLPKDGWQPSNNSNAVEAGKLSQTFDAQVPGTWGGAIAATFFKDNTPEKDLAWAQFGPADAYGAAGFCVVRYGLPFDTPWADGQEVEVWPVLNGKAQMNQTATNTNARFGMTFYVPSEPEQNAVIGGAGS